MKIRHQISARLNAGRMARRRLILPVSTLLIALGLVIGCYVLESRRRLDVEFDCQAIDALAAPIREQIQSLKDRAAVDDWLERRERAVEKSLEGRGASIKKDLRKGVVWAKGLKLSSPISIVYVHGFSASRLELDPVIAQVAEALGANVFFTRLTAHGLTDGEEFAKVRARDWAVDVEEALAIGRHIGERVIVIGMSTGASLVLENQMRKVSAENANVKKPAALVLLSPNYEVKAHGTSLLEGPFAGTIAHTVLGDYHEFATLNELHAARWTWRYRIEGIPQMLMAVGRIRSFDFSKIDVPVLTVYSSKDDVVDSDVIASRSKEIKSTFSVAVALPEARLHQLMSAAFDPEKIPALREVMLVWIRDALGIETSVAN